MVTIYFNGNLLEPLFKALRGGWVAPFTCGVPQIQTGLPGFETKKRNKHFTASMPTSPLEMGY